ncbi:class A sortase [Lactococcus lactis]|uniref:class A sortase n=1 Tax=Lactococcus lactis TaxID=1358 RepID=UPI002890CA30|nr:class A sortase [Lactococcus lactis]MDT2909335.1 class A sortase [Lactococcus lactis]MDT2925135.1 class A sortase [Lactococcus lactis]MDT2951994.1 class A sortase [Lactococcus lactis]
MRGTPRSNKIHNKEDETISKINNKGFKKKKKLTKTIRAVIFYLALFCSIVLIFQYPLTQLMVKKNSSVYSLKKVSLKTIDENKKIKGNFDTKNIATINFFDIAKSQLSDNNYPITGGISYPALGINLPVFNGDGDNIMTYGAGTMKANQIMGQGNFALASHHVSNVVGHWADNLLFSPLEHAKTNQEIYLTDKRKVYKYRTSKVSIIKPSEGNVILDQGKEKEITLITCYSDDRFRILVQGKLESVLSYNSKTKQLFSGKLTQYNK